MYGRCYKRRYKFILSVRYKSVEAFKMDLEGSPPETTYERCKVWIRQRQAAVDSLPPFTSVTLNSQYVDLAKSLPRPWLPAAIVEPKKDDDTEMEKYGGSIYSPSDTQLSLTRMFQQTLDGSAGGWFERLPHDSINECADLKEAFAARYSVRRACFKEPHEITKIVRKAKDSLTTFKERWTVETGFIMGVPEVMKISSFMDSVKSPELANRFLYKVPTTVNEMMERLDDFVRSEEAYARTKLLKGEVGQTHRKTSLL
ncbi:hypothetical protein Tco_1061219 [Tanacetum coccineum]